MLYVFESLDMKAMSNRGFGNGKATMDNGYGLFLNMLAYKLDDRGKILSMLTSGFHQVRSVTAVARFIER